MSATEPAVRDLLSEIQQLHEDLRLSEARFRDVIERNADAIVVIDVKGTIQFANQAANHLFGRPGAGLAGTAFGFPVVTGETAELDLVRDGEHLAVEMHVVESQWLGKPASIATLRNVTQRKAGEQHERDLIRSEAARATAEGLAGRSRFLAESTAVLSSSMDSARTLTDLARLSTAELADWVIIYAYDNGKLKRTDVVHADPSKAAQARKLRDFSVNHEAEGVARLIETRTPQRAERIDEAALQGMVKDEAQREIIRELGIASFMFVPMIARQKLIGAISFISADPNRLFQDEDVQLAVDLAARAALAVDNAKLYEEARKANQAKSELLAIISHDLRTPLNSILGYGQLLQMGIPEALSKASLEHVERMMISAKHQLYLIDELLHFARLDSNHEQVERHVLDVRTVLNEAADLIKPVAEAKQLELQVDLPDHPHNALTDPDKLRQILINLLGNAVRYTERGSIRLELTKSADGMVVIRVRDTGIGIAPEHLPRIFDPFWQVDHSQRTRGGGTGLGLAVVKQGVELLGGKVSARSTVGSGSVFQICIPGAA